VDDLARSEDRLRMAQAVAGIGTWETDFETGRNTWSEGLRELMGLPADEEPPDSFVSLVHPDDRGLVRREVDRDIARGGDFEYEFRIALPDGSHRWILTRGRMIKDADGKPLRKLGVAMDISARHEADEHRERLEQALRQAQKLEAVGRLAGGVAHDFNNLLLGIRGYGELALRALSRGEAASEEVEEMIAGTDRASALTRQLLAFSRQQVLRSEILDLNEIASEMDKLLRGLIGDDVLLETIVADEPVYVNGDRSQLEQVVANLAVNARDAMPDGGQLTIQVCTIDLGADHGIGVPPGRYAMLAVCDTGTGFDDETAARIFEPFFTTKIDGTGLGLATVHGIVTQSDGSIWTYSELGEGATFKVYLPLVQDAHPKTITPPETLVAWVTGQTILLVEDDQHVRAVVERMLDAAGYLVLAAGDGEAALELARDYDGRIDLLLSDLIMPGLGGRETAERLAKLRPETAVLFMSGYTDDAVLRRGVLTGGAAFLEKPFGSDALNRRVRDVLEQVA
jgi:PAS domain S-box-containing protein